MRSLLYGHSRALVYVCLVTLAGGRFAGAEPSEESRDYEVLFEWNESARNGEGPVVVGRHVVSTDGTRFFDLYTDAGGAPLDPEDLSALGIPAKRWDREAIEQDAESPAALPAKGAAAPPVPLSASSLSAGPSVFVELPPIDIEQVLLEDDLGESTSDKGVLRTGVFQDLEPPIRVTGDGASSGAWEPCSDGGRLWAATLYSPDAVGQRVHFSAMVLPAGARVVVYDMTDPAEAYGPYHAPYGNETDLWGPTCFADAVTVECYVPAGADAADLRLEIDRTVHVYRELGEWFWAKAAGPCNLDVACDEEWPEDVPYSAAEWATTALGVGGLGTVGVSGNLWCSGALIADTDQSSAIPYFWTANHCIASQSKASSIEVYWLYQRDGCGGTVPSPTMVPRTTGGADYLAGATEGTGTDFTLLRLRNDPPAGLTYLGWSSSPVAIGTGVTCIHHPSGDYKRISFGTLTDDDDDECFTDPRDPQPPLTRFHQSLWYAGTTERGSSGSPLMSSDSQRIIGQLYGGYASCFQTQCPDYYGRFDVMFPAVESWLAPEPDPADIDGSGTIDSGDIQLVVNAALGIDISPHDADVNDTGKVDAVDVQLVIIAVLSR